MKTCSKCNLLKEDSEFYFRTDRGVLKNYCKKCINQQKKDRRYVYPRNLTLDFGTSLIRKYGLSLIDWDEMVLSQGGVCAICSQPSKLCVDHDHRTEKVRGLICQKCNRSLGGFNDSEQVIASALEYLHKHSPGS